MIVGNYYAKPALYFQVEEEMQHNNYKRLRHKRCAELLLHIDNIPRRYIDDCKVYFATKSLYIEREQRYCSKKQIKC